VVATKSAPRVIGSALAMVLVTSCAHPEGSRVPEGTPSLLARLAEEEPPAGEAPGPQLPPLRRDRCGLPVVVSVESLFAPGGVRHVQESLVARGVLREQTYRPGELDESTLTAVREFQEQVELPAVGLPTYSTVRALGLDVDAVFTSGDAVCEAAP
jgi:hypothetical protein